MARTVDVDPTDRPAQPDRAGLAAVARRLRGPRRRAWSGWVGEVPASWSESSRRLAELGSLDLLERDPRRRPDRVGVVTGGAGSRRC